MRPEIVINNNKADLIAETANKFYDIIHDAEGTVNISLSGGNTPKILFTKMIELYKSKLDWEKVRFWWGDERCVPPEHSDSNYKMAKQYLLDHLNIPLENIYRIKGENKPSEEADRYGRLIEQILPKFNGVPQYDIILLGLGTDGHTASIFPDQINLFNSANNCVVCRHPESGQSRVSITGKVINNASHVIFLITGKNKAEVVRKIINREPGFEQFPAALVDPEIGNSIWYVDQGAASLL